MDPRTTPLAPARSTIGAALAWWRRGKRLVPRADRVVLRSPARLVWRFARSALAHRRGRPLLRADDLQARDPALVSWLADLVRLLARHYFRLRVEGMEHVPRTGPVLLVGNHNGGMFPADALFIVLTIHDRHGPARAVYALAHDMLYHDPLLCSYALRLGVLRASHENAHRALAAGHGVLVYPGGDHETFRPFRQRRRVDLYGRKGFLRLALRARVPIVPVVSAGTHEQLVVLARGERLGHLLHWHDWARTEVYPLVLALPWGLTSGFIPYLPLPAQTSIAFGPPIAWPGLGPTDAERPEVLERCYREVEARMQAMLDRLDEGRRFLLGKRRT
jgi:1-acyl-sn-glycerol-3-phosphate acyltransferase